MRTVFLPVVLVLATGPLLAADAPNPRSTAAEIDRRLNTLYATRGVSPAPICSDEDFLRRAAFDLAGRPPKPEGVLKFARSSEPDRRARAIDIYLSGDDWAANWASYWRDVLFSRATNQRAGLASGSFEVWLTERLAGGAGWDEITTDLLTATGDVRENGATALIYAHDGNAEELAGEVSRIFLGIQLQCANCHDHPYDSWTREEFHSLAAFFPRVRVRPIPLSTPPTAVVSSFDLAQSLGGLAFRRNPEFFFRQFDKNGDGKVTKAEVAGTEIEENFGLILLFGDRDRDGAISLEELRNLPLPAGGNNRTEWYMPDLSDPSSRGEVTRPQFFLDGVGARLGTSDLVRRKLLAVAITDRENPWFARALVNRIWTEMVGRGFYTPVDDLGPERDVICPDVLDLLCNGLVASGYDLKWLLATIANTEAYQRAVQTEQFVSTSGTAPFAAARPTRMRADHVYAALVQVIGEPAPLRPPLFRSGPRGTGRFADRAPRREIISLFGFDPSMPSDEVTGDVPQALFLMNSPVVQSRLRADGNTPLGRIVADSESTAEVIERLYLLALSRRPTGDERQMCEQYVADSSSRLDAYEDLLWGLVNSAEFVTKR